MSWFKNPWDKGGEFSPDHVKEGIDRWFADSPQNVYWDDHNLSIPANQRKYFKAGQNLEGISIIFLLRDSGGSVRQK